VPIVVTLVVADGMIRGITDRYLELGTGHLEVYDRKGGAEIAAAAETAARAAGVVSAWPERQGLGLIVGAAGKSGAAIRAVAPDFLESAAVERYLTAVSGVARLSGAGDALLGEALAKKIGASVGDTVRLMTTRTTPDGRTIPRLAPFTVRGIVSSGYSELDALWCLIDYPAGLRILPPEASRSYLSIKTADPYGDIGAVARSLEAALGADFVVYTWSDLQYAQFKSYQTTRQLLLLIMALIVMVAAVNVASATTMLAVERRRDIAVLKSFGADPRGTTLIFVLGGALTGLIGTAAGLAAGLSIAVNINQAIAVLERIIGWLSGAKGGVPPKLLDPQYYLENFPVVVDWPTLAWIGAGTVVCSVLAAWRPARRAGRLAVCDIIRKY
jgi:lipoprotein-releasing system permease protein